MSLEKIERRMWNDMRREWDFIDKIYVDHEEFERLKQVRLSQDEISPVLEALFRPEKKMFLDDIVFIVSKDDNLKRIIHLHQAGDDRAALTVYDGDGRLFGKASITIDGDHVNVRPDPSTPVGVRYFERYAKSIASQMPIGQLSKKNQSEIIQQSVIRRMYPRIEEVVYFILSAIHQALTAVEIRQIDTDDELTGEEAKKSHTRTPHLKHRAAKKLHRLIYEGRAVSKNLSKKQYIKRVAAWKVRGHYRTYPSGKRVWVKPYVKGWKSEKFRPLGSEYRL